VDGRFRLLSNGNFVYESGEMKMSFVTHKQAVNASRESEIHGKSLYSRFNRVLLFPALHESSSIKISSTSVIFIVNSNMRCSRNLNETAQHAVDPHPGQLCLSGNCPV